MASFLTGISYRATASLSWGEGGTYNTPTADDTFPIALEAPVRNALLASATTIYNSTPFLVSSTINADASPYTVNDHTVSLPSGVQAGDILILYHCGEINSTITYPAGWTQIYEGSRSAVAWKVATDSDALGGATVTYSDTAQVPNGQIIYCIRGAATVAVVEGTGGTSSADPPSDTISWGLDAASFVMAFVMEQRTSPAMTISSYPSGYTLGQTNSVHTTDAGTGEIRFAGAATQLHDTVANPGAYTFSGGFILGESATIIVKGQYAGLLQVRTNFRVVQPTAYTNSQTFYGHTISISLGLTVLPAVYADPDGFQTHSIRRTIKPNLHASTTQTLNPTLKLTVKPGAFTNAQAFFTQSIRRTLRPTAYTDADTINAHSIRRTIRPGLYSDPDTINAQSIVTGNTVAPAAFTNAQAFYSPRMRVTLKPGLYADADAFFTQTLRRTVRPSLFSDSDAFYAGSIRRTVKPAAFSDPDTFYGHMVPGTVRPGLYTDADTFHAPTISLNRLVNPAAFSNAQVFRVQTIRLTVKPIALASTTTVPSPAIRRGINPALFVNAPTFRTQTVQAPYAVQPARHTNTQVFPLTRVIGPPTPFSGLSGLYTTGFIRYKAPKVKKQDVPKGFILPPPEGIPDPSEIQRVRAYPLRKGELKGRTVLVNQPPPGGQPAQTDALDLILAALLLGRPNDGA